MPQGYSPSVFISSTCYDLNQIRIDIKKFIESLGFDPILSEYNSFPVNPRTNNIQNCLDVVSQRADILLLLIGNRYGYQTEQGHSVTNLEYLRAKAKGIPIYIFIKKSMLDAYHAWKNDQSMDLSAIVDSPKLFDFIKTLYDNTDHWVFPFESATDISNALRHQLAYLFMDSLILRNRIKENHLEDLVQSIKGESLRLVIEQPPGWEYLLFSQVLLDGISSCENIRYDLKYKINLGKHRKVTNPREVLNYLSSLFNDLQAVPQSMTILMNQALQDAFGPSGQPGNATQIIYVANRLVDAYRFAIEWAIDIFKVNVPDEFRRLYSLASEMPSNIIDELEEYAQDIDIQIKAALKRAADSNESQKLELICTLTIGDTSEFEKEQNKLIRKYM